MAKSATAPEDALQVSLLRTPLGAQGSAMTRYAAAMYFYQRGLLTPVGLEAYRICAVLDHEDPQALLDRMGLPGLAPIPSQ